MESISNTCSLISSLFGSVYSIIWSVITTLGFWKCLLIVILLVIWLIWEIITKGTHPYKTENGLTPVFNSFIGATTYFWLQMAINLILETFFTKAVYCLKWPYALHITTFFLTGFLLNITGVWSYWKIFGKKIRIRKR